MSDLYHIPNDDGKKYRLDKFVEYQHEVPSIHYRFLGEYTKRHNLTADEAVDMCWLMSLTYNEITCIYLFDRLKQRSYSEIWEEDKPNLLFGSARKHVKLKTRFVDLMGAWLERTRNGKFEYVKNLLAGDAEESYVRIQRELRTINEVGRFASDLFLEMLVYLKGYLNIDISEPAEIDWKNCANLASGIFNIFYEDERANRYDRDRRLSKAEEAYLSAKLKEIQTAIHSRYPAQNCEISMFIGKICSFRNLFKAARYGGYHHDRELEWLRHYEAAFPNKKELWEEAYALRQEIFPSRFLGELNGWDGIRKERKKLWIATGKTGVEVGND